MPLECELKYIDVNLPELSRRLEAAEGECLGRYFESNLVFDGPKRSLKDRGVLLRLREKHGQAVLTVKRPPENGKESSLKVFEEIETGVDDFASMKIALETIGFSVAFAYEKIREKWKFEGCVICLDSLPFGDYVEIEGTEESVPACANSLGLGDAATSKMTYHALNIEYRRKNGLEPNESFVFDKDRRATIFKEIGEE